MTQLIQIITARDAETRNRSLDAVARALTPEELLKECAALDQFRRSSDNLYERVRRLAQTPGFWSLRSRRDLALASLSRRD